MSVDPGELSTEGLWEYQKWVLCAPLRWSRRLMHRA